MASSATGRPRLTRAAGWIAAGFGVVHLVVAPWETRETWAQARAAGWWNTVTLEPGTSAEAARTAAFWRTLGSFGAPMLVLGVHVLWSAHHGQRVPARVGWTLLAWSLPFVTVLPASPGWTIPLVGGLIVAGGGPTTEPGRRAHGTSSLRRARSAHRGT